MSTVMQLENVYRLYRMGQETIAAVDGVSLSVRAGEILCLQGPSGSGKSTLLHMMAGLDRPTKGSIVLGRTHIEKLSEDKLALFRQRHVGFIFQSYYLIPTLTAIENVTMPLMFAGIPARKRLHVAKELLEAVGLKDRMRHKPSQMSGGQQQRVSIARAFANNPKIVFADEPTGNLDTHTTYEMMNLMTRLARERNQTLVIVTHDLEISSYASRLVKIRDGRIEGIEGFEGISDPTGAGTMPTEGLSVPAGLMKPPDPQDTGQPVDGNASLPEEGSAEHSDIRIDGSPEDGTVGSPDDGTIGSPDDGTVGSLDDGTVGSLEEEGTVKDGEGLNGEPVEEVSGNGWRRVFSKRKGHGK